MFPRPVLCQPKPPAKAFRGALEEHWIADKALCLDEPLNGCLDMLHTHRNLPLVENMLHLAAATCGTSNEVRESKLTIRDHRQQTAQLPSKAYQLFSDTAARRCDRILATGQIFCILWL